MRETDGVTGNNRVYYLRMTKFNKSAPFVVLVIEGYSLKSCLKKSYTGEGGRHTRRRRRSSLLLNESEVEREREKSTSLVTIANCRCAIYGVWCDSWTCV